MSSPACLDESTFTELLLGTLPAERAARVDEHLDTCASCRRLVAEALKAPPAAAPSPSEAPPATSTQATTVVVATPTVRRTLLAEDPPLERGTAVGRYLVVERVGAGGMGVVYSAYDPELDRRVALKLLRAKALGLDADKARAHLLHEAQAMARVSHPHVVSVYDVGTFGTQVFLAMEWVEAQTLRQWLKEAPRGWRLVRDVFAQAGQGLAAAHAAGLVHGDFKPENVLVGRDGRVRVTDFGLARTATPSAPPGELLSGGTPAYMAPEQFVAGGRPDARSDQFSFCAALYEGLYRERPFCGDTETALSLEVRAGRLRPTPKGSAVPPWLRRVVLRGLATRPEERHGSLRALLEALGQDPAARGRRALPAVGGLVLVLGAAGITHAVHSRAERACAGAGRELEDVWDPARQQQVREAFLGTGKPFAAAAWTGVQRALEGYTAAWVTTRTAACEATRVRGEQPEDVMAQRMRCLDQRLAELAALTRLFAQADAGLVERAPRAVQALTPLSGCSDVAALASHGPAPTTPEALARAGRLREALAEAKALKDAGRFTQGLARLEPAAHEVKAAGERGPAADALLLLAELRAGAGDKRGARQTLLEALWQAEAGRNDGAAAQGWTLAVGLEGESQQEQAQAALWRERADAAIERLGGDVALRARLDGHVANGLRVLGRYPEAAELLQSTLARLERLHGPDALEVADARLLLGAVRLAQGHPEQARALFERTLATRRQALGPDHPDVAEAGQELSAALWREGRYEEAERNIRQALEVLERALGPEHPRVGVALNMLAACQLATERNEEAVRNFERSLRILDKAEGPESSNHAILTNNLASVLLQMGQLQEAEGHFRQALRLLETNFGPDYPVLAKVLRKLAQSLHQQKRHAEALPLLQRAARLLDAQQDDVYGWWRVTLLDLGQEYLDVGQPREALAPLERALAGREGTQPPAAESAQVRFLLARALWEADVDRARALRLADEALERARALQPPSKLLLPEVEAWLAARRQQQRRPSPQKTPQAPAPH